jgi:hypothetical protein
MFWPIFYGLMFAAFCLCVYKIGYHSGQLDIHLERMRELTKRARS